MRVPIGPAEEADGESKRQEVITRSRAQYATARSEIEASERRRHAELAEAPPVKRKEVAKPESTPIPSPLPPQPIPQEHKQTEQPEIVSHPEIVPPKYETTSLKADLEELGRGGDIHKAAQLEFKRLAESLGFRATIERQLPDSLDTVDLYLERDGVKIACEVSVTNTLEYEMKNVTKCLRAGVSQVLVMSVDSEKHRRLSAAVANLLSPEDQKQVLCLMKEEFPGYLDSLPSPGVQKPLGNATEGKAKMVKGWKVRVNTLPTPQEDVSQVEKELAATMAESLRRRKTKKREKK